MQLKKLLEIYEFIFAFLFGLTTTWYLKLEKISKTILL